MNGLDTADPAQAQGLGLILALGDPAQLFVDDRGELEQFGSEGNWWLVGAHGIFRLPGCYCGAWETHSVSHAMQTVKKRTA